MLNIKCLGKPTTNNNFLTYYTKPDKLEYYSKQGDHNGIWSGKLKNDITFSSKNVTHEEFVNLAQGLSPKGKQLLHVKPENHRIGDDLTFNLIKSASVAFAGSDEQTKKIIEQCHQEAVRAVLEYIEKNLIFVREQTDDKSKYKKVNASKCLFAEFLHHTNREGDVNIHTHVVLFNLAKNKQGQYKTIETKPLKQHVKALGAMYRNEVAHLLNKRLGLEIAPDREYFTLPAVAQSLIEKFSKRSQQIKESLLKSMIGMSPKARQIAALQTRKKKEVIHLETQFDKWKTELDGWSLDLPEDNNQFQPTKTLADYREELLDALVEKQSVFKESDLMEAVHIRAQWHGLGLKAGNKFIRTLLKDKEIKKLRHPNLGICYTTQKQFDLEKQFYSQAINYAKQRSPELTINAEISVYKARLNDEQKVAFDGVVTGTQLTLINGKPGTGKSYLMGSIKHYYEDLGKRVLGCAPSGKAASELQQGSGIKSSTIDSLLLAIESKRLKLRSDTVLVCDETGMVGIRKLSKLLSYVEAANSKIVLLGDFKQLQAVEAGNCFYNLIKKVGTLELNQIQRQNSQEDINNIEKIANGETMEVLEDLQNRGLFHVEKTNLACKAKLVDDWYSTFKLNPNQSMILASTKSNVFQLNVLAREKMLDKGMLTKLPATFKNHDNRQFTVQVGERIMFRRNSYKLSVQNGLTGEVVHVNQIGGDNVNLKVKLSDGRTVTFNTEFYNDIDYGYAATVHKSQGMTVNHSYVFMSNDFMNNNLFYVEASRSRNPPKLYAAYEYEQEEAYLKELAKKSAVQASKYDLEEATEITK